MRRLTILLILSTAFLPFALQAQTLAPTSDDISISITPPTPGPNVRVTADLYSSTIDLTQANISWTATGSGPASGKGMVTYNFTSGAIGTQSTVTASISSPEGSFEKTLTFSVGSVDLLWQGSGYVPPFYRGLQLWGRQTLITFLAIPHVFTAGGTPINPSDLVYRWSKDGTILEASSGTGKNSLTLNDTILGLPIDVKVEVLADASTLLAYKEEDFAPRTPNVLVYVNNPYLGYLFNSEADTSLTETDTEATFSAFPFFFSTTDKGAHVDYTWQAAGSSAISGEQITYRSANGQNLTSSVHVEAESPNFIAQSATKDFLVQFVKQTNPAI